MPTPATGSPPSGWSSCWPSGATSTGCGPGPTPATGPPPSGWPSCWPSGATSRGDHLLRARADTGDRSAAERLVELLAERGDIDEAAGPGRHRRPGRRRAAGRAAGQRGDIDGLRARADTGDRFAAERLAELLAERGDIDGLRARADTGDGFAAERLAELLAERGDLDEAITLLRARADTGDRYRRRPAGRAAGRAGRPRGVPLRARADTGDGFAAAGWPSCWPSGATSSGLRARADTGDRFAAGRLAELLAERGDLDEAIAVLRPRRHRRRVRRLAAGRAAGRAGRHRGAAGPADTGDEFAAAGWPSCWPSGATPTGCGPAPTPATAAAMRLVELLAERGDLDGLQRYCEAMTVR